MATTNITQKVAGSDTYNERKILADDVNQIREAIQTGAKDIKPNTVQMVGNTITADNGSNWIRRTNNTFQYHNGSAWVEPTTANLLTFTAGENIAARNVVYLKVADGKIYKASNTNNDWIGIATAAITSGASGTIYPNGSLVGGFSGLTSGTWYGLNATAGTLTANENYIVGLAISATQIILVKPKGDMSTKDNALYKLQGEKAINDVSDTNSGVLAGSSQVLIDKFLDANGQNNTVDTATTTSLYNTSNKYYKCALGLSTIVLEPSFETITNWTYSETDSQFTGEQSTSNVTDGTYSYKLGFSASSLGGGVYCQISQPNVDVTNISEIMFDYYRTDGNRDLMYLQVLLDGTTVYNQQANGSVNNQSLTATIDVSAYTGTKSLIFRYYKASGVNYSGTSNVYLDNIRTSPLLDSTIQSVATTIPTGMTKVFVTPLMYEALATGDSITADVSIDNGAHYTTGVPINTWTPITSANGTQLIVKANLLTNDGTTTPKVLGWRVLLE